MVTSGTNVLRTVNLPLERIFWTLWVLVSAWLLACAFLVSGEYGDGYVTIANSRHLFGDNPLFNAQRGPLAAIMLWPAEKFVGLFDVGAFEVTPYHLYSALLHSLYLLGCWWALRWSDAGPLARLLAFTAAIMSVAFYAYSPYLSHDILPGLLFLLMIFVANRWLNSGSRQDALILVLVGAAVVLIKQMYAVFWVSIVFYGALALVFGWDNKRVDWRKFGLLLGLAALSAGITWTGYAWSTAMQWPDAPWYQRPWLLAVAVSEIYGRDAALVFPADLYLRNLHNLGLLAMLLVIPGLIIALRGKNARLRMMAICWLLAALALQLTVFKEVRYALFLAPLTAALIVPVIEWAIKQRLLLVAMVLLIVVDQVRGFGVAATQLTASASIDPGRFFAAAGTQGRVVSSKVISFVFDAQSPMQRDAYHGIYHISGKLIFELQGGRWQVQELADTHELGMANLRHGDRVYIANTDVRRVAPYIKDNTPHMLTGYRATAGRAAKLTLQRQADGWSIKDHGDSYVILVADAQAGPVAPLISTGTITAAQLNPLYGDLSGVDSREVTGIIVDAMCQADNCQYR